MSKYLDDIWDEVGDPDKYVTRSSGVYEALDRLDEVLKAIVKERDKAQQLLAAYQEEIRPGQYCCSKCGKEDDKEAQRRSFAYGNVKLSNDSVTREIVDRAADKLAKEEK